MIPKGARFSFGITGFKPQTPNQEKRDDLKKAASETAKESAAKAEKEAKKINPADAKTQARENFRLDIPKLQAMRKRARLVIQRHADHRKGIAEGKIVPWAELRAQWPKLETQILNLQRSHAAMIAETDPKKRLPLSKAFFAALQPIGPFLQPAAFRLRGLLKY